MTRWAVVTSTAMRAHQIRVFPDVLVKGIASRTLARHRGSKLKSSNVAIGHVVSDPRRQ
jgi:hypothetical protein